MSICSQHADAPALAGYQAFLATTGTIGGGGFHAPFHKRSLALCEFCAARVEQASPRRRKAVNSKRRPGHVDRDGENGGPCAMHIYAAWLPGDRHVFNRFISLELCVCRRERDAVMKEGAEGSGSCPVAAA
eukprot:3497098-Pleurochrysis_carterae.AAC.3